MDHVRIDEGVKRERRAPPPMQHRPGNGQFVSKLPADLNDVEILQRIAAGERTSDIARGLGVTPAVLYTRYSGNEAYREARKAGTAVRIDLAETEIEVADDPLTLARAREVHRTVAWRASVEHPEAWGDKRHITVELTGDLGERLRRAEEREIEGAVVAEIPNQAVAAPHLASDARDSGLEDR